MAIYWVSTALSLAASVVYQWWLRDLLFVTLGIGRTVEPIEKFPYDCYRLQSNQLESCGDMWLDESNHILYAICSSLKARREWNPNMGNFNVSGRRAGGSSLMAIYIDEPRKDGLFRMHRIRPSGYGHGPGDGHLDLISMDAQVVDPATTRFWLLNQRPLYDAKGNIDKNRIGANITIDVYEHRIHEKQMSHIATSWSPTLHSANKIALMGGNNFVVSNQRSAQSGLRRKLDPLLGGGSLIYYDDWLDRYTITPKTLPIPGSIVRGQDDHIYVPSLVDNRIRVFQLREDQTFKQVYEITLGIPVAGLTVDSRGSIWAVGRSKYDQTGVSSTNSVFKIENLEDRVFKFVTEKVLEDKSKAALDAASVAWHDVKTKRIFVGGQFASGVTVCKPRG